jgi:hypothetical protein
MNAVEFIQIIPKKFRFLILRHDTGFCSFGMSNGFKFSVFQEIHKRINDHMSLRGAVIHENSIMLQNYHAKMLNEWDSGLSDQNITRFY